MLNLAEELNVPGAPRHPGTPDLTAPMLADPSTQPVEPPMPRVAVLLNARARRVTPRVLRALSRVVPRADLYLSRSPKDARRIAQTILSRGYDTVFCGGGDGTFIGFADEILSEAERAHASAPRFGVLKLGTGNGLAALVQASAFKDGGVVEDVRRACEGAVPGYRPLELLKVEGRRAQFAGLGLDARLLNDYLGLKSKVQGTWGHWALTGSRGYALTVGLRTLPNALTRRLSEQVEVRNGADVPAYRLDASGQAIEEVAPGALLYRGPAMMVAASTIPFYGYALRMFPFAGRRKGHLHLRLGTVNPLAAVANLRAIWRGEWFPKTIHD
ncbi:MAG TPA: diacylglycerol kinase family protein, partial [Myxococcaceae bacterium]|nr:diacylglycerol kinase family protein [Myxococcaceae bacterium]